MTCIGHMSINDRMSHFLVGFGHGGQKSRGLPLPLRWAALLVLLAAVPVQAQTIHYVDADATGSGDGTSWADAFPHLQAALAVADAGDQVWMAEGLYKPTDDGPDPEDRTATFALSNGVALYGGFAGTETTLEERDWTVYETILSGDVGVPGDSLDNSYHVVTVSGADSTAILDGFIIQHGTANGGSEPDDRGGGFLLLSASPTLRNLTIRWNTAAGGGEQLGGGMYVEDGSSLMEDILFERNVAFGGGLYASGGQLTLRRVRFSGNITAGTYLVSGSAAFIEDGLFETNVRGGGLVIRDSNPIIRRTVFRDNSMEGSDGGAVYVADQSEPLFEDCLFEGNRALAGGGAAFSTGGGIPTFIRSTFRDNVSEQHAGGGAAEGGTPAGSPAYYINCRFEGNEARRAGGLDSYGAFTTVLNSVFVGNRATSTNAGSGGGGFYVFATPPSGSVLVANTVFVGNTGTYGGGVRVLGTGETEVRLVNTTITGNTASEAGGGLHFSVAPGLRLQNSIVWGNDAPQGEDVFFLEGAPPTFEHSIVGGGCPPAVTCHEVFDADPRFVRNPDPGPDGQWGTDDDDYGDLRLQEGSPAEDLGLEAYLPRDRWDLDGDGDTEEPLPVDLGGGPRVIGAAPDLGAYEGVYPVGVQDGPAIGMAARLALYPNPARDVVVADVTVGAETEVVVALYDVLGRRVARLYEGLLRPGTTPLVVEAPDVPGGVYLVRVTGAGLDLAERITLLR